MTDGKQHSGLTEIEETLTQVIVLIQIGVG